MANVTGGTPGQPAQYSNVALGYDNEAKLLQWFQQMWLSNRDMEQLVDRCLDYDFDNNQGGGGDHAQPQSNYMTVNGMSDNTGMHWCRREWDLIGYRPRDNVGEHV